MKTRTWITFVGAGSLLGLVGGIFFAPLFRADAFKSTGAVTGASYFHSEIMRGLPVSLCSRSFREDIAPEMKAFAGSQDAYDQALPIGPPFSWVHTGYYPRAKRYVEYIQESAAKKGIVTTTTNIEGRYRFAALVPGEYLVCGTLVTDRAVGYWLIPITVIRGRTAELDLSNLNVTDSLTVKAEAR